MPWTGHIWTAPRTGRKWDRLDATALAKYYGLVSTSLGNDYSAYVKNGYRAPETAVSHDTMEPETAVLTWTGTDEDAQLYTLTGTDAQSRLVYYDYSTDGGKTWSELLPFDEAGTELTDHRTDAGAGDLCTAVQWVFSVYTDKQRHQNGRRTWHCGAGRGHG